MFFNPWKRLVKILNRLIFTQLRGQTAAVLVSGSRILQIDFEPEDTELGCIYIGKVKNIVKNINAAFVEYRPGVNGYYSLTENRNHLYTDNREHPALHEGDEILVQVERAAVKTKDAVLSSDLNLPGRYAVLTAKGGRLGISSKIRNREWKEQMKLWWEKLEGHTFGLILRTNAMEAEPEEIYEEVARLEEIFDKICSASKCRTCLSLLYKPESFQVRIARDTHFQDMEEVLTDNREIYDELSHAFIREVKEGRLKLRFYEDSSLALSALYSLNTALDRALSKQVWLKSGGYLVIEPTEAMTVIDVNTGKNMGKQAFSETAFQTNLEAAGEIAAQMRLRNLSGIIIIDFIDMEEQNKKEELLKSLKKFTSKDPVPVTVVDMTSLGLVEVTRKKIKKPLYEQIPSTFSKKPVDIEKI